MGRVSHPVQLDEDVGLGDVGAHGRQVDELRTAAVAGIDGGAVAFPVVGDPVPGRGGVVEHPGDVGVVAVAAGVRDLIPVRG